MSCSSSDSVIDVWLDSVDSSIVDESSLSSSSDRRNRSNIWANASCGDDDGLDEEVGDARDIVERDDVVRVENADGQAIAAAVDGDEAVLAAQVPGHQCDDARVERHVRQVDVAMPGVESDRLGDLCFGHQLRS